jgi:hypothetical protein
VRADARVQAAYLGAVAEPATPAPRAKVANGARR